MTNFRRAIVRSHADSTPLRQYGAALLSELAIVSLLKVVAMSLNGIIAKADLSEADVTLVLKANTAWLPPKTPAPFGEVKTQRLARLSCRGQRLLDMAVLEVLVWQAVS